MAKRRKDTGPSLLCVLGEEESGDVVEATAKPAPSHPKSADGKVIYERDYQIDSTNRIFSEWKAARSTLVVQATGTGKTVVATNVCGRVLKGEIGPGGFLFMAHRDELIRQARDTFRATFPNKIIDVEQGGNYASPRADIVISSVQTMHAKHRLELYRKDRFAAACIDEAHHASKSNVTYWNILEYFAMKYFGLTATPDRSDEVALGQTFETVAFTFDIIDAVREGWLVPVGQRLEICDGLDYSEMKIGANGDFDEGDLAERLKKEKPLYALCDTAIKYSNFNGKTRPTLVFTASKEHACDVADILNRKDAKHGTGRAAVVHYKIDKEVRREIIAEYKRGNIRYLTNYGILGEGFDDDETRVIVNGRPTKSRSLFAQMFGRATRPLKELMQPLAMAKTAEERRAIIKASRKPGALMVDLRGLNHKLVLTMTDILGGRSSDAAVAIVRDRVAKAKGPVDVEVELAKAEREVAAIEASKKRTSLLVTAKTRGKNVDPFDVMDVVSGREPGWAAGKVATDPQKETLIKFGIPEREVETLSCHKASRLIEACFERRRLGLCSYKVARLLAKYGYDRNLLAKDAKVIIERIKANGWRRPDDF